MPEVPTREVGLRHYLGILRRRWLIVLVPIVLVPLAAYFVAHRQTAQYQANATVYVKEQNLGALASGSQVSATPDPVRTLQTQISLAETPTIAARVLQATHVSGMSPNQLLGETRISADPNADILTFTVTDRDPVRVQSLATNYAVQYTQLRHQLDTQPLAQARAVILAEIRDLSPNKKAATKNAAYIATLRQTANQLQTQAALSGSNAVLASAATGATQTGPKPTRYGLFGLGLGALLGIGLAFLGDALDTRVRSADK